MQDDAQEAAIGDKAAQELLVVEKLRAVNYELTTGLKDAFCELARLGYSNPRATSNLMKLIRKSEALGENK